MTDHINPDRGTHILQIQCHDDDTYLVVERDHDSEVPFAARVLTKHAAHQVVTAHIHHVLIETVATKDLADVDVRDTKIFAVLQADEIFENIAYDGGPTKVAVIGLYEEGSI